MSKDIENQVRERFLDFSMRIPFKSYVSGSKKVYGKGKSLCLVIWIASGIES